MLNRNLIKDIVIVLIITIIFTNSTLALGISPGSTTIDFKPNLEKEIKFKIINNQEKFMRVALRAEGDLAQYITLPQGLIDFTSSDKEKSFSYTITLPQELEKPGPHTTKILAIELPSDAESEETFIGAKVGVAHKLTVLVPYPGTYAETKLKIKSGQVNETTKFTLEVYNFGTENIDEAQATIEIRDPQNNLIDTVTTNKKSIDTKKIGELTATWTGERIGIYKAIATLDYDSETTTTEQEFYIGSLYIELLDVQVKNFRLGDIAKFELDIENQWNDLVKNVFAEITMVSLSGEEIDIFKSTSSDIPALAKDTIIAYWDTSNIDSGNYLATIAIGYADGKRTEKQFNADITLENIRLTPLGGTGQVIAGGSKVSTPLLVGLLVALLIVVNIIWFIYFKRKTKTKNNEKLN